MWKNCQHNIALLFDFIEVSRLALSKFKCNTILNPEKECCMPKTYRNLSDLERAQIQAHLELGCKVRAIAYALRTSELVPVGRTP